ncbi:MAG: hypothetical protein H8D27_06405 [Chlorobium phaeobacteroides]|nr:hypothetical protein [Chlorobium phaeobacteroides]
MKRSTLTRLITAATIALTMLSAAPAMANNTFTPATTLEAAEAAAKQTYNFIAYKSQGNYGKKIAADQRLDRLNRINKEVSRVETAFAIELPRVKVLYVTDRSRGFYNYTRDEIVFSTKRLEHTLRHEFAHVIDRRIGVTGREWKSLVNQMKAQGFSPSNYAETNLEEYWAEAFAYFTAPGYGTTTEKFPAELESFITNVINQLQSTTMLASN